MSDFLALGELFELSTVRTPAAELLLRPGSEGHASTIDRARDVVGLPHFNGECWLTPTPLIGDAHDKYNPAYVAAILSADGKYALTPETPIPRISFTTDEDTRRSMTLNGMRMTLEYRQTGSRRLLELIENRLELGQRDIVHNVLVYQMNAIWDLRAEAREERSLRAESVAAYLGLNHAATETLFASPVLDAAKIADAIARGEAGAPRRRLDPLPLLANQLSLLQPELDIINDKEADLLDLVQEIVGLLRANTTNPPAAT